MELKPLYTERDYEDVIYELMTLEVQGLLSPQDFLFMEIMCELLEAYEAKHDPEKWYQQHCKNSPSHTVISTST